MMIRRITFFLVCIICISKNQAQSVWCRAGIDDKQKYLEAIKDQDPYKIQWRSERWLPVAVHVVMEDPQSFSYARILHQIDVLNKDFAKKSDNILKLNEEFVDLAADTEIRFCLAATDPDGNPTTGVTFTQTDIDNIALERNDDGRYVVHYDQLGGKTGWDPTRYINIWIAEYGNGILGYGSLPGTAAYPEEMGLVMDPVSFGSLGGGVQFYDKGHSLTHEMGHYLGLLHIWGDDDECIGSDEVDDTPNASGFYIGCPSGVQVSCGVSNMYQNFMDLTDDRCLAAFTHGQAERMQNTLDNYYPLLSSNAPCESEVMTFANWAEGLTWVYDPASGEYLLYSDDYFTGEIQIDIFSSDGRLILSDKMDNQLSYFIDFDATSGIYFVLLSNGKDKHARKIVVY